MAHVNWKSQVLGLTKTAHPTLQSQLELTLTADLLAPLAESLAAAFAPGGAELRLELPQNWTIYWKPKAGLSRLQLAHPQADHWVATVHLSHEHGAKLIDALAGLTTTAEPLVVSRLGSMAPLVNFELVIAVKT